jgi:hypothetical protein
MSRFSLVFEGGKMYTQLNLRDTLKEWKNRLYNAPHTLLNRQLDSFISQVQNEPLINAVLLELLNKADLLVRHPMDRCRDALMGNVLFSIFENQRFVDDSERAMYHYCLLKVLHEDDSEIYRNHAIMSNIAQSYDVPKAFVERYVDPLVYYLYDRINEGSEVLYLLEKYKRKCEWFEKHRLRQLYEKSQGHQEQVLDEDLRKFLFEQGIDYPFSTPSSPSGEADVVGLLHTDDPLVLEVKIFDRDRDYRKQRIIDGFRQIVSYSNDYHKPVGYLLIFNRDTVEVNIETDNQINSYPVFNKVLFLGKVYFIVFVNIPPSTTETASKRGQTKKVTITEAELTTEVTT